MAWQRRPFCRHSVVTGAEKRHTSACHSFTGEACLVNGSVSRGYSLKCNTDTLCQTKLWTPLVTSLSSFFWLGRVWNPRVRMLWQRQKQTRKDPQPWLVPSFSELRKLFFLPRTHLCSLFIGHTQHVHCFANLFFPPTATWPLKESDEFTADSLWLRAARSTDRMTLSEVGAYRY